MQEPGVGGLDQVLARARHLPPETRWPVSVTTNQTGGHITVASGVLAYVPSRTVGRYTLPERLATEPDAPLQLLSATPDDPDASFATSTADRVGLTISCPGNGPAVGHFTLISWAGSSFDVILNDRDGALIGTGPSIGGSGSRSTFVVAFAEPQSKHPTTHTDREVEQPRAPAQAP
jgi:hypothetical protein